jgi:hypothetical protein
MAKSYNLLLLLVTILVLKRVGILKGSAAGLMRDESWGRVQLKCDGTWWRMGGEVKGKLVNGVGSQYSYTTSEHGASSITTADAHTSAASSRLNWSPCRFKWTHPFRRKTKSGFCACAVTFQMQSTCCFFSNRIECDVSLVWASQLVWLL